MFCSEVRQVLLGESSDSDWKVSGTLMGNTVWSENKWPSDGRGPQSGSRLELPVRAAQLLLHNQAAEKKEEPKRKKLQFHLKAAGPGFIPWKNGRSGTGGRPDVTDSSSLAWLLQEHPKL